MAYVTVFLISIAVAFPAGWLVCRAWLKTRRESAGDGVSRAEHDRELEAQRSQYQAQIDRVAEVVRRHETARDQLKSRLDDMNSRLEDSQRLAENLRADLRQARAAEQQCEQPLDDDAPTQVFADESLDPQPAKRFGLNGRSRQREPAADNASDDSNAARRAQRGELREKLAASEHRSHELESRLAEREARIEELAEAVNSWKLRIRPLTRQLETYRETVHQLQTSQAQPAPTDNLPADPLQQIKGIGPALERRLNAHGIRRFAQLAELEPAQLAELADKLAISPALPTRGKWIDQARELASPAAEQPLPAQSAGGGQL